MPHSLACIKYRRTIEREIRDFWSTLINIEYTKEFLSDRADAERTTSRGYISPYSYVDLPIKEYVANLDTIADDARENAVVSFITAFEVYLSDVIERILYLKPDVLSNSDRKIDVPDLIDVIDTGNLRQWLSRKLADKICRNQSHVDVIKRIQSYTMWSTVPVDDEIDLLKKWIYVRNAIVHVGRHVSEELAEIWHERFPNVGSRMQIKNNELMHLQAVSLDIVRHVDEGLMKNVVENEDAMLLVRELYVREGTEDVKYLRNLLFNNMGIKSKTQDIQQAIAYQKRTNESIAGFDMDSIYSELRR